MNLIDVSLILVTSKRQRREFPADKLYALTDSIQTNGLLHPIGLRQEGTAFYLVYGERRLRAIQDLADLGGTYRYDSQEIPLGQIPYVNLSELDPLEAETLEAEENLQREDLTWREKSEAVARLHTLRTRQAEARGDHPTTIAETALEVQGSSEGYYHDEVKWDIILANNLDRPEVAGAKTKDEAKKALKRIESLEKSRALSDSVGRVFGARLHKAIHGDSLEWLAQAPAEAWDVILTDPPYGMGADEFGDSGGLAAGAHGYEDTPENFQSILQVCAKHFFRLAKPEAHLYWFCDIDQFHRAREAFGYGGWTCFRTPLIWHKPSAMRAPWPEHGPQRKWECLLYAMKGKRPVLKMAPDLFAFSPDANLGHAAQKPVALFEELLRRSCRPGDSVLDPFMGSGTIFPAAHGLKVVATGVELDSASYGMAVKRLEGLKDQLELAL